MAKDTLWTKVENGETLPDTIDVTNDMNMADYGGEGHALILGVKHPDRVKYPEQLHEVVGGATEGKVVDVWEGKTECPNCHAEVHTQVLVTEHGLCAMNCRACGMYPWWKTSA